MDAAIFSLMRPGSDTVLFFLPARRSMAPDTSANAPAFAARQIFYNDRGLRAGWRLLIYCGMIAVLAFGTIFIAKSLGGGPKGAPLPDYLQAIFQAGGELFLFLVLLFLAWIMSRIERRKVGAYGLPLQRSALSAFVRGYFLWGFIPLTFLLLVLRVAHAFYFGNVTVLNARILGWGLLWFAVFLFVGLFEEYMLRGYFLFT